MRISDWSSDVCSSDLAAAKATGTTVSRRILGYAAPQYGNKPLAEAAWKNIKAIGMPVWSGADQAFAREVQTANGRTPKPLDSSVPPLSTPFNRPPMPHGGSDDVGDRSEEHTSEFQSLMRISYAVFCLKKKKS